MKLTKIEIRNYGPIKGFSIEPGGFELMFGLNESGKTAIVEALSYVLFRKDIRLLRYGKPEEIKIEIESAGRKYILPSKKSDGPLPPLEIAGLLYVMASESSLYKEEAGPRFWDTIKLMMGKVGQKIPLAKMGEKVLEYAGMTAKGKWKESKQKTINEKEARKSALEKCIKEMTAVEEMKRELNKRMSEFERLEHEIRSVESAKKYHDYKVLKDLYASFRDRKSALSDYERYNEEQHDEWQKLEAEKSAKSTLAAQLQADEENVPELQKKLDDLKRTNKIIEDGGFRRFIANPREPPAKPSLFYTLLAFLLGMATLILSFQFRFNPLFSIVLFGLSIASLVVFLYQKASIKRLHLEKEIWLTKARLIFPELTSLSELDQRIEVIEKDLIKYETLIEEKRKIKESVGTSSDIISQLEARMASLRSRTGLSELFQLRQKIEHKRKLMTEIEGLKARISSLLQEKDESAWPRKIEELKVEPPATEVDMERLEQKVRAFEQLKKEIENLKRETRISEDTRQRVYGVADAREALAEIWQLQCEIESYDLEQKAALKAFEILGAMSSELDDLISSIMESDDTSVSQYFYQITERYKIVKIQEGDFTVVDDNSNEYEVADLSSGAKDQLMLCFRMAALKRLYPDGAFLLLDDAFIFADWQRRQRLALLISSFAKEGNQVIYLTSDDHTRELFRELGARVNELTI